VQITRLGICFLQHANQISSFSSQRFTQHRRQGGWYADAGPNALLSKCLCKPVPGGKSFLLPFAHYAARRPPIIYGGNSGNGKLDVDLYLVWFGPAFWQSMCFYMCAYEMGYWILRAGHCESLSFFARKMIRPSLKKTIEKAFYLLSI